MIFGLWEHRGAQLVCLSATWQRTLLCALCCGTYVNTRTWEEKNVPPPPLMGRFPPCSPCPHGVPMSSGHSLLRLAPAQLLQLQVWLLLFFFFFHSLQCNKCLCIEGQLAGLSVEHVPFLGLEIALQCIAEGSLQTMLPHCLKDMLTQHHFCAMKDGYLGQRSVHSWVVAWTRGCNASTPINFLSFELRFSTSDLQCWSDIGVLSSTSLSFMASSLFQCVGTSDRFGLGRVHVLVDV